MAILGPDIKGRETRFHVFFCLTNAEFGSPGGNEYSSMKKVIVGIFAMLFYLQAFAQGNVGEAVDLYLPSGTLWSDKNIGASVESDAGSYFAYGELYTKYLYCKTNYTYYNSKTNSIEGPDGELLEIGLDAARHFWGEHWRHPTMGSVGELFYYTTQEFTSVNGMNGLRFTGINGKSIFLPFSGEKYCNEHYDNNSNLVHESELGGFNIYARTWLSEGFGARDGSEMILFGRAQVLACNREGREVEAWAVYYDILKSEGLPVRPIYCAQENAILESEQIEDVETEENYVENIEIKFRFTNLTGDPEQQSIKFYCTTYDDYQTKTIKRSELNEDGSYTVSFHGKAGCSYVYYAEFTWPGWGTRETDKKTFEVGTVVHPTSPNQLAAIDLGLPSGNLWLNMNLGAESCFDIGLGYAFGGMQPADENGRYNEALDAAFYDGTMRGNISGTEYDVVTATMGEDWWIPSIADYQELVWECKTVFDCTENMVDGRKFIGNNGNCLFIPFERRIWLSNIDTFNNLRGFYVSNGWYIDSMNASSILSIRPVGRADIQDIESVRTDSTDRFFFNLRGERVQELKSGSIYFSKGKKMLIK